MQVVIKLETVGDFMDLINTIEEKQLKLAEAMKEVDHKSSDEDIKKWIKWNKINSNLQQTLIQLNQALKS